jgi:G:T-mismatch repair DNA endonuclease (very short patch repair protein)
MSKKLTTKEFIKKSNKIHNDKYNYSLTSYVNSKTKVKIICSVHGAFEQVPSDHLSGSGCKICSKIKVRDGKRLTTSQFITKATVVHGNRYDYSLVKYKTSRAKIKIICPIHGTFEQVPHSHLQKRGCYSCSLIKKRSNSLLSTKEFIKMATAVHSNKYDYSATTYTGYQLKLKIICPDHGKFEQTPDNHLHGSGCPKCSHIISKPELEICEFLDEYNIDYEQSNRYILNGKELDIVIHSKKIAIEFNGLYWHSESMLKGNVYHRQKYVNCKKEGYQLISIFEPEWIFKKDIVKSIILAKLNIYKEKIGARKCELKIVTVSTARKFFVENHIQGFSGGTHIGLFFKDQLVSCISFRKNKNDYELTRFVNKKNTLVHGAFSKLLKYFINNNSFESIFTFADLRYFEGQVYEKNGFKFVQNVPPSYYYFKGLKLFHKRNFQHKRLKEKFKNYDSKLTEYQNCLNHGHDRIWDCGKLKFEYIK